MRFGTSTEVEFDHRRVLAVLLAVDGLLLFMHLVSSWLLHDGQDRFDRTFGATDLFDLDQEVGVGTWWSQLLLGAAGFLAFLIGHLRTRTEAPWANHWKVLGGIFVFVSIDEGSEIHERFIEPTRDALGIDGGFLFYAWLIPAIVLLMAFAVAYLRFWIHLPPVPKRLMAIGGSLYVVGTVLAEMIGGAYDADRGKDYGYSFFVLAEEGFEMVGASIFLVSLVAALAVWEQTDRTGAVPPA